MVRSLQRRGQEILAEQPVQFSQAKGGDSPPLPRPSIWRSMHSVERDADGLGGGF